MVNQRPWQALVSGFLVLVLSLSGCQQRPETPAAAPADIPTVPTPNEIARLSTYLEGYSPRVSILSPPADSVLPSTTVTARFDVSGYPLFKDPDLGLGPHLHVVLDNEPYIAHYDANAPLTFNDLKPGTHTLRVFASRPWHESFKNRTAYAQTTFHILAPTPEYAPQPQLPLLTYSRPNGSYGAEPIMFDFWLTNAPIHESIVPGLPKDWQVHYSLNGKQGSTTIWEPLYLTGFQPGDNIFTAELVDGEGEPIRNVFNSTARVITYTPGGSDTLSRLVRGELSADAALGIVQKAEPKPQPTPSPSPAPTPTPEPTPEATPSSEPDVEAPPVSKPTVEPTAQPTLEPVAETTAEPELAEPTLAPTPEPKGGFFDRLRGATNPEATPEPAEPSSETLAAPEPTVAPEPTPTPVPTSTPEPTPTLALEETPPQTIPSETEPELAPTPVPTPEPKRGFFGRFRSSAKPAASPAPVVPSPEPTADAETEPVPTPKPEADTSFFPEVTAAPTTAAPTPEPTPTALPRIEPSPESTPEPTPRPRLRDRLRTQSEAKEAATKEAEAEASETSSEAPEPTPEPEPTPVTPTPRPRLREQRNAKPEATPRPRLRDRLRAQPTPEPSPEAEPTPRPRLRDQIRAKQAEVTEPTPSPAPTPVTETPVTEPTPAPTPRPRLRDQIRASKQAETPIPEPSVAPEPEVVSPTPMATPTAIPTPAAVPTPIPRITPIPFRERGLRLYPPGFKEQYQHE